MPTTTKRRRRVSAPTPSERATSTIPRLYTPFRALGIVCSPTAPIHLHALGLSRYISAPLPHSFHVYDIQSMNLIGVGPRYAESVTALIGAGGDRTLVGLSSGDVSVCVRMKEKFRLILDADHDGAVVLGDGENKGVKQMLAFDDELLVLSSNNMLYVWNLTTRELTSKISFDPAFGRVTSMLHPDTYLNKICVGTSLGHVQIFNIRTCRLVHTTKQAFSAAVSTMAQSPALDVIGIGLDNGKIHLHDIRQDAALFCLQQTSSVTSITFQTTAGSNTANGGASAGNSEDAIMATAGSSGDVTIWDLEKERLVTTLPSVHDGGVLACQFLPAEPIMITSGVDNAIKQWIFDRDPATPRVLKSRSGHRNAPAIVRWFNGTARIESNGGATGDARWLLTAGRDRAFRLTSAVRDSQSVEMSQGSIEKNAKRFATSAEMLKLPPVLHFSTSQLREREWDNVVTVHRGETCARVWSTQRRALGQHRLVSRDNSAVVCSGASACGNFAFLGTETGRVDAFNIQSGIYQRSFGTGANAGHAKAITGIFADVANRYIVTSSLDAKIKLWRFKDASLMATVTTPSAIHCARAPQDTASELLAFAHDDNRVRVLDASSKLLVRTFVHPAPVTDIAWSPDVRWITTACADSVVRTWDVATGYQVHRFGVRSMVVGLDWSGDARWLATVHVDSPGVYLWTNRSLFAEVPLRRLDDAEPAAMIDLPRSQSGVVDEAVESISTEEEAMEEATEDVTQHLAVVVVPDQSENRRRAVQGMIQLSDLPKSKWHTLLNLDTIKKRNRPVEPPKAPAQAPFMLPTLPGSQFKFKVNGADGSDDLESSVRSKVISMDRLRPVTAFVAALQRGYKSANFDEAVMLLEAMSVSAMDLEIRTLELVAATTHDDEDMEEEAAIQPTEFEILLAMVESMLASQERFDLAQACLAQFLRCHGDELTLKKGGDDDMWDDEEREAGVQRVRACLRRISALSQQEWRRMEARMANATCLLAFSRRGRV